MWSKFKDLSFEFSLEKVITKGVIVQWSTFKHLSIQVYLENVITKGLIVYVV